MQPQAVPQGVSAGMTAQPGQYGMYPVTMGYGVDPQAQPQVQTTQLQEQQPTQQLQQQAAYGQTTWQ